MPRITNAPSAEAKVSQISRGHVGCRSKENFGHVDHLWMLRLHHGYFARRQKFRVELLRGRNGRHAEADVGIRRRYKFILQ